MWDQHEYERLIGKKTPTRREVWAAIRPRMGLSLLSQPRPFSIAAALAPFGDRWYHGYGAARCNHVDEWNPATGANIAKGRAVSNLLDTIMASLKGEE